MDGDMATRAGTDAASERPVSSTLLLDVLLHRGRQLKKTRWQKVKHLWMDNVMDPYVIFEVTPPSGEDVSEKKSICAGTTEYPIWEQTITFQIDASDRGQLLMVLCDSSLLYRNMMSKTETIDISTLKIGDKYQRRKFPISSWSATGVLEISLRIRKEEVTPERTKMATLVSQRPEDKKMYPDTVRRLDVIVQRARNLEGVYEKLAELHGRPSEDTMYPFVRLTVTRPWEEAQAVAVQNTRAIKSTSTSEPEWNETLSFLVNTKWFSRGQLQLTVWDARYEIRGDLYDPVVINLSQIKLGNEYVDRELDVHDGGKLVISLRLNLPSADVRFGGDVHPKEQECVAKRREIAASKMKELGIPGAGIGAKVPTIGIVGSGGGIRAMIGMSGAIRALQEEGLLDCCTYMSTLSGSTWYLSVLYSLKDFPDVDKCTTYLKEQCSEKLAKVMTKKRGLWGLEDLQGDGTAVGVWGEMLGDVFQEQLMKDTKTRLSDAQKNVSECHLPFPIYTAVLVRDRTPTESYGEWMEFTHFDYGIRNFKIFANIEDIANARCQGIICRRVPLSEYKLSFMQGIWGSAFADTVRTWINAALGGGKSWFNRVLQKTVGHLPIGRARPFAAWLPNYMKGIPDIPKSKGRIDFDRYYPFSKTFPGASFHGFDYLSRPELDVNIDRSQGPHTKQQMKYRPGRVRRIHKAGPDKPQSDRLTVLDAGLEFNLPFPPLFRPERHTDIFLVFEYSWRDNQYDNPFDETSAISKAKKWAEDNGYKFPKFSPQIFCKTRLKEYYVLEDENDLDCPVIIFFPLCNVELSKVEGKDGKVEGEDAGVNPFSSVYSTHNFHYDEKGFDQLHKLCYCNTKQAVKEIKKAIAKRIQ